MNNYQAEILLKSPKEEPKGREIQMMVDTVQAIELDVKKTAGSMEAETDQDNLLVIEIILDREEESTQEEESLSATIKQSEELPVEPRNLLNGNK